MKRQTVDTIGKQAATTPIPWAKVLPLMAVVAVLLIAGLVRPEAAHAAFTQVAAGGNHTVALEDDGTVWAWGRNDYGQLGDGTTTDRFIPTFAHLTGVTAVAAGESHTVALMADGTVMAWGSNEFGQLGDGTLTGRVYPRPVPGLTGVTAIAAGRDNTLALKNDGTVWEWGEQPVFCYWGCTYRLTPTLKQGLTEVTAITTSGSQNGRGHTLVLLTDGTVMAWGYNYKGQLGDGTLGDTFTPKPVQGLAGVVAIAVGELHSMALLADGTLRAWGYNGDGQLGNGTTTNWLTPTLVPSLTGVMAIAAGGRHTMTLMADGTVNAWGQNDSGQLGDGTKTNRSTPVQVPGLTGVLAISAGGKHTMARRTNGMVMAWGDNNFGQLGYSKESGRLFPSPVTNLTGVAAVAAGGYNTVALLADGTVWAWGGIKPALVPGLAGVTAVAVGFNHTVALKDDGTVWAWGYNPFGQLGDGTRTDRLTPTPVAGLTGVAAVAVGDSHTIALKNDGTVWTWGYNGYGQLGDGTTTDRLTPTLVPGLTGVAAVKAGYNYSVVLLADGTVWAWGDNSSGQLGDGTIFSRYTPHLMPLLTGVAAIEAGGDYAVALLTDGTVWTWGYNGYGQLGDGTTTDRLTPTLVPGLTGVAAVAAGGRHTVALLADGTVMAWGENRHGQLGDGTTTDRHTPSPVAGLTGVAAVAAGFFHTMALLTDGTVRAWGDNSQGQLGGDTTITPYPVAVTMSLNFSAGGGGSVTVNVQGGTTSWSSQVGENTIYSLPMPAAVTLTVTPDRCFAFAGWSGDCTGAGPSCAVTMDSPREVTARFLPIAELTATYYRDYDNDGYGNPGLPLVACADTTPAGYVANNGDWDDDRATVYPGAPEICDGRDNNGDGLIDEADPAVVLLSWYADGDGDGYGDPADRKQGCAQPAGYVANDNDCNDTDPAIHPYATEICDGIDNDCDGLVDVADPSLEGGTWYLSDGDGDSYGDYSRGRNFCQTSPPPGYVVFGYPADCDDSNAALNPADQDGDGFSTCDGDCNDNDPDIYPWAAEVCGDGIDNNCDGVVDGPAECDPCLDDVQCGGAVSGQFCRKPDGTCTGVGTCQPLLDPSFNCPIYSVPVCGCDGKTYDNSCEAIKAGASVAAQGACAVTSYSLPYYFPSIKDDDTTGWENYLSVQAKMPSPMDVTLKVYDLAGKLQGTYIYSDTTLGANKPSLAANARVALRPSWIAGSAANPVPVEGSVVVETSVPAIASTNAIANFYKGFSIYESAKPRQVHNFPKAYDGPAAPFFQVYMLAQNIYDQEIQVTVTLLGKTTADPGHGATRTYTLPAHATLKVRPSEVAPLDAITGQPIDFTGSVVITSEAAIPAMCRFEAGTEALAIYESTVEQPALYFPVIKDGKFWGALDYQNFVSVVNPSATATATITLDLYSRAGNREGGLTAVTIPPGGKKTWRPSWITGSINLPKDFEGSLVVTTDIPVVGQTNTIYPGTNPYGADGFDLLEASLPANLLFFPKVYDNLPGSGTGATHLTDNIVYVQNPSASSRSVDIELYNSNGTLLSSSRNITLAPHAMHVFRPKDLAADGSGVFRGSIKVIETSGQPITGGIKYEVHTTTNPGSGIEAMTIYRSMGQ